jgi:hypothetical protein
LPHEDDGSDEMGEEHANTSLLFFSPRLRIPVPLFPLFCALYDDTDENEHVSDDDEHDDGSGDASEAVFPPALRVIPFRMSSERLGDR